MLNTLYWIFAIEAAMIPGMSNTTYGNSVIAFENEPLSAITLQAEYGLTLGAVELFATGSTRSTQMHKGETHFTPILQRYDIGAGLRLGNVEIGARHFCEHPVMSHGAQPVVPIDMGMREVYARVELRGGN